METTTLQQPSTGDEFEITPNGIWELSDTSWEPITAFSRRFAETV